MNSTIDLDHHASKSHSTGNEGQFDLKAVVHELKHYLPAQSTLKDFIHHNTLHAFQNQKFHAGIRNAAEIFGYKVSLQLDEYREAFAKGKIRKDVLEQVIAENHGVESGSEWMKRLLEKEYDQNAKPLVGRLRNVWRTSFHIDLDTLVHPTLFRILCSYLDQGISIWDFPVHESTFLGSIRTLEQKAFSSFFRTKRAKKLLKEGKCTIENLLGMLIGQDQALYAQYLFDLQFAHQGWSGLVAQIEEHPESLLAEKPISLEDLIVLELLLEIDALDAHFGTNWKPLETALDHQKVDLFAPRPASEYRRVLQYWQEAYEWSYYDSILAAIKYCEKPESPIGQTKRFQAMFCIDDRECSFRRYVEAESPDCETFGTAGFFGVEFYFQPEGGKFYTKLCPAPVNPQFLIKEFGSISKHKKDMHLSKRSHSLSLGWLISQTVGFWSAVRLFAQIARPSMSPAMTYAFQHHDRAASLTIENTDPTHIENGMQVGFNVDQMIDRVENLLRSIGLIDRFAPIVYVVGHGSSSVNNPHFAAYDCGACSGRPGSVNARVLCHMANLPTVRKGLAARGISIPSHTRFIGGLHDTCRDEIEFFDEEALSPLLRVSHDENVVMFERALDANAKERSRRLELIDTQKVAFNVHQRVKSRSVSLFEPRPELNHATNALCVVGRRSLTRRLFLDRRSFMNSYNYRQDPEGKFLLGILKAVAPVCGGINLEYFFSRVDNQKLGAGSKLPHNVMGLIGVANGADGDLRPGLPSQMIEVHDPVRLLVVVEHDPQVVLRTVKQHAETYEWFQNEWVHLVVYHPEEGKLYRFRNGEFEGYEPLCDHVDSIAHIVPLLEQEADNIPVYQLLSR
jgi:uncharacterized protein YbcC (UPF0753/DUF2309 family)